MLPNHSWFPPIEEKQFLAGRWIAIALEKRGGVYLHNEFQMDARKFLEELTSTVLSTVAARLDVGQGLSCFCPEIVVVKDDYTPFHLFGQPLDVLMELGWFLGSTVEASKAGYQSFVRDQKQVERISTRCRPDVGTNLSSWSSQAWFPARRHLYQVGNI